MTFTDTDRAILRTMYQTDGISGPPLDRRYLAGKAAGIAEERERCARICDALGDRVSGNKPRGAYRICADAIRAQPSAYDQTPVGKEP